MPVKVSPKDVYISMTDFPISIAALLKVLFEHGIGPVDISFNDDSVVVEVYRDFARLDPPSKVSYSVFSRLFNKIITLSVNDVITLINKSLYEYRSILKTIGVNLREPPLGYFIYDIMIKYVKNKFQSKNEVDVFSTFYLASLISHLTISLLWKYSQHSLDSISIENSKEDYRLTRIYFYDSDLSKNNPVEFLNSLILKKASELTEYRIVVQKSAKLVSVLLFLYYLAFYFDLFPEFMSVNDDQLEKAYKSILEVFKGLVIPNIYRGNYKISVEFGYYSPVETIKDTLLNVSGRPSIIYLYDVILLAAIEDLKHFLDTQPNSKFLYYPDRSKFRQLFVNEFLKLDDVLSVYVINLKGLRELIGYLYLTLAIILLPFVPVGHSYLFKLFSIQFYTSTSLLSSLLMSFVKYFYIIKELPVEKVVNLKYIVDIPYLCYSSNLKISLLPSILLVFRPILLASNDIWSTVKSDTEILSKLLDNYYKITTEKEKSVLYRYIIIPATIHTYPSDKPTFEPSIEMDLASYKVDRSKTKKTDYLVFEVDELSNSTIGHLLNPTLLLMNIKNIHSYRLYRVYVHPGLFKPIKQLIYSSKVLLIGGVLDVSKIRKSSSTFKLYVTGIIPFTHLTLLMSKIMRFSKLPLFTLVRGENIKVEYFYDVDKLKDIIYEYFSDIGDNYKWLKELIIDLLFFPFHFIELGYFNKDSSLLNLLLIGKPGTGKSTLLKKIEKLYPNSALVLPSTTEAGLFGTIGSGKTRSVTIPGSIVLANNGFLLLDDFDHFKDEKIKTVLLSVLQGGKVLRILAKTKIEYDVNCITIASSNINSAENKLLKEYVSKYKLKGIVANDKPISIHVVPLPVQVNMSSALMTRFLPIPIKEPIFSNSNQQNIEEFTDLNIYNIGSLIISLKTLVRYNNIPEDIQEYIKEKALSVLNLVASLFFNKTLTEDNLNAINEDLVSYLGISYTRYLEMFKTHVICRAIRYAVFNKSFKLEITKKIVDEVEEIHRAIFVELYSMFEMGSTPIKDVDVSRVADVFNRLLIDTLNSIYTSEHGVISYKKLKEKILDNLSSVQENLSSKEIGFINRNLDSLIKSALLKLSMKGYLKLRDPIYEEVITHNIYNDTVIVLETYLEPNALL